jgi:hypothetical protein
MLASNPASILNQETPDLGIPTDSKLNDHALGRDDGEILNALANLKFG